jgi:hypothetical protein
MTSSTIHLYRAVLRSALRFPSRNKLAIVEEIKHEFRAHKALTDDGEIAHRLNIARDGLDRLNAFSNMDKTSSNWQVSLKGPHTGEG